MKSMIALLGIALFSTGLAAEFTADITNRFSLSNTSSLSSDSTFHKTQINWQLSLSADLWQNRIFSLDAEAVNSYSMVADWQDDGIEPSMDDQLSRGWLRASTPKSELRIGLQRLNFGSAQVLRPLQWFDTLDPKDKLEQTEGVHAVLLRHYFLNNSNIWLWAIRGEGKQRGLIPLVTKEGSLEFGGRLQYPLLKGELGLTLNHRQETEYRAIDTGAENRIGMDLRLDYCMGIWLEGFVSKLSESPGIAQWQVPLTLGADYTIGIGNGVYTMLETQLSSQADKALFSLQKNHFSLAWSANYPLNLLDSITYYALVRDAPVTQNHSLIWRRNYDNLGLEAALGWDSGIGAQGLDLYSLKLLLSYII
jgi:hypothetical protein